LIIAVDPGKVVPKRIDAPQFRRPVWPVYDAPRRKLVGRMSDDVDTRSDRSGGFRTEIGGRLIVVTIGSKSQTLGVCTPENRPGAYERRYRFLGVPALTPDRLDGVEDLDALTDWVANFGAAVIDESGTGTRRPLPSLIPSVGPDEPWLRATAASSSTRSTSW
jgi:hypothetical protein